MNMTNGNLHPTEPSPPAAPVGHAAPPPAPSATPGPSAKAQPSREERFLAAAAHLCIAAVLPTVLGPLLIWVIERNNPNRSDFVMRHAKQALVYQGLIAAVVAVLLLTHVLAVLGYLLAVVAAVYGIAASLHGYSGDEFEYFYIGRFIGEL